MKNMSKCFRFCFVVVVIMAPSVTLLTENWSIIIMNAVCEDSRCIVYT